MLARRCESRLACPRLEQGGIDMLNCRRCGRKLTSRMVVSEDELCEKCVLREREMTNGEDEGGAYTPDEVKEDQDGE